MTQHSSLSPERWAAFSLDQQILMIGNELNRVSGLMAADDAARRRNAYARVLQLTDLTIGSRPRPALLRELLRWRDVVAALYLREEGDPKTHRAAFRCLLRFTPVAARQIPLLEATR
jgi:hypothetical protein